MTRKRRILSADDHVDTCDLITKILDEFDVVSAHSTAHGLREATAVEFDRISWIIMPDGTGLELSLLIRDFEKFTATPYAQVLTLQRI